MVPNVSFVRKEIAKLLDQYTLIRDVLSGSVTVKNKGTTYLPKPNPNDTSKENAARYRAYLQRAVFYNVARRTLNGLVGQVFNRPPVIEVPNILDNVIANSSGTGVNITQQAKKAVSLTLAYSRCGLFIDYPDVDNENGVSIADLQSGRIRPTISLYHPTEIINWRLTERGAEEILSLVVLFELWPNFDDGFEIKNSGQYRVLRLNEQGFYEVELWREIVPTEFKEGSKDKKDYQLSHTFIPKGPDGNPLTEIPFTFIGSENNDSLPDNPNFYDLCDLNIAHYRNSADYEESCYICGQATPVATGLTEEWIKEVFKDNKLEMGSNAVVMLPKEATFQLHQAEANTMIKEAMDGKERQMVAIGAKLVENKTVQRTATEATLEATSENSTLTTTANNVSAAFKIALEWCAFFMGADEAEIKFELNTEYDITKLTPEARKQAISEWQSGATTFGEMRSILRKAGAATLDDDEALTEIQKETDTKLANEVKRTTALSVGKQTTPVE